MRNTGLEALPDEVRNAAPREGWDGPWELFTWRRFIEKVIKDQSVPVIDLPEFSREKGTHTTNLDYYSTSLDAWGSQGVCDRFLEQWLNV